MITRKTRIGLISFSAKETSTTYEKLIEIIGCLFEKTYVISSGSLSELSDKENIVYIIIPHQSGRTPLSRIYYFLVSQIRVTLAVIRINKNVDLWMFYDASLLLIPLVTVKFFNKYAIQLISIATDKSLLCENNGLSKMASIIRCIEEINLKLVDKIFIYSERLIGEWNLNKYMSKISIVSHHFINFEDLYIKKPLAERECVVGFIGRLSYEKGISNFLKSIPLVLSKKKNVKFLIGGGGPLNDSVVESIKNEKMEESIDFVGWIPHEQLPDYLNRLSCIVIPSFTESGPLIMIEAISCGVPVIGTPVGNIPNVIIDGRTGFIMKENSPEHIAHSIIRALDCEKLEEITENALNYIKIHYNLLEATKKYESAFSDIDLQA